MERPAMAKEKTTRLNLVLPQRTVDRLDNLREKTEAVSYVEIVKNALKAYEVLVDEFIAGNEILSRGKDGVLTSYKLLA
jgi:hypothetical protein